MKTDITLTDGFVVLRPYRAQDAGSLHAAVLESMAELHPYMDFAKEGYSPEQSEEWVANCPERWEQGEAYNFAIADARTGEYLGGCGLNTFDPGRRIANLGYWVRTSRTRSGVATAATRLLADFGMKQLSLKRIGLGIAASNIASQRVAEKAGASREGVLRNGMFVRDLMYDEVVYSFIPTDTAAK